MKRRSICDAPTREQRPGFRQPEQNRILVKRARGNDPASDRVQRIIDEDCNPARPDHTHHLPHKGAALERRNMVQDATDKSPVEAAGLERQGLAAILVEFRRFCLIAGMAIDIELVSMP